MQVCMCVRGSPGPCVSMEIEDDGVGGAKGGDVPVALFPLSFSPHLSGNCVPETHRHKHTLRTIPRTHIFRGLMWSGTHFDAARSTRPGGDGPEFHRPLFSSVNLPIVTHGLALVLDQFIRNSHRGLSWAFIQKNHVRGVGDVTQRSPVLQTWFN